MTDEQAKWEKILDDLDLSMSRGSVRDDPRQKYAVVEYLENIGRPFRPATENDVKNGFHIEEVESEDN